MRSFQLSTPTALIQDSTQCPSTCCASSPAPPVPAACSPHGQGHPFKCKPRGIDLKFFKDFPFHSKSNKIHTVADKVQPARPLSCPSGPAPCALPPFQPPWPPAPSQSLTLPQGLFHTCHHLLEYGSQTHMWLVSELTLAHTQISSQKGLP